MQGSLSSQMKSEFKLPMVAGASCGEEMMRRNYRKTQIFGSHPDRVTVHDAAPVDLSVANVKHSSHVLQQASSGEESPTKADLSNHVLRFFGFTKEVVSESNVEKERVRRIVLCHFLEDGTSLVSEPRVDNSGFAFQGTLVKRHVIPTADGSRSVSIQDFAVGADVSFYGRTYHLVDADAFTREYYSRLGAPLGAAQSYPADTYTTLRARPSKVHDVPSIAATSTLNNTLSSAQIRATQQFLQNDRQVLRCDCIWDDKGSLYGEVHYLTLYYFLADDHIAVVEKDGVNTGRDPFPNFVKRQKIPRPSESSSRFENVSSSLTFKSKDADACTFYTDADIRIGNELNVFGRIIKICDYDLFTREYLQKKFGVTEYNPIDFTVPPKPKVAREPPPYNGFGDEEDSLGSCQRLDLKPPKKDGARFAKFGSSSVKFVMKLDNGVATDDIRRFVLTCFLADDTICIFEPVQRNSGIVGGKFLQRQKVKKPDGTPFVAKDFYVGCRTAINGFPFVVTATDERSLSYMELNPSDFPHSSVVNVIEKCRAYLLSSHSGFGEALLQADNSQSGALHFEELKNVVRQCNVDLTDHELLTLLRHFDRHGDSYISNGDFIARVLPTGSTVGRDSRTPQEIYAEAVQAHGSQSGDGAVNEAPVDIAAAARGARQFLELYHARRQLFISEFRFVADYAKDSIIGEQEFKKCCKERLHLAIPDGALNALARCLFPEGAKRVAFEELMKLFNGTSNLTHNLDQIKNLK